VGPADDSPTARDDGNMWTFRHIDAVRTLMLNRDDRKPIWATEFGWSSHPNDGTEQPWELGVSEREQGQLAVQTLRLLGSDYPYVRKAFWYNERNKQSGNVHQDNFGVLDSRGSPKPIYYALRDYLGSTV
jgi:exo-beta-1,3-glucanase (GH17 family)